MRITVFLITLVVYSAIFLSSSNSILASGPDKTGSDSAKLDESSESAKLNEIFKTIIDPGSLEVGDSLVSPSSPLYFLKSFRERIELYLSANDQIRAQRELEFAVRRLREVKTLIEEGRQDLIEVTLQKYRNHIDRVKKIGGDTEDLRIDLGISLARHMYVLQSLYYNTSNELAKRATRTSIERVLEYNWELLASDLEKLERQTLTENVGLRQIAGCQFLNQEVKNTGISEAELAILKEYTADCKHKAAEYFTSQINNFDNN